MGVNTDDNGGRKREDLRKMKGKKEVKQQGKSNEEKVGVKEYVKGSAVRKRGRM